ncbi:hypothetical protein CVT24_005148, partial [Panaeolus cyanescens]
PKRPNKKKPRLSPRQETTYSEANLVPSSQSDEEELPATESNVNDLQSALEQPWPDELSSYSSGPTSPIPSSQVSPAISSSSKQSLSMPATPVALDATAKTAQIIEKIKQRAYAAVHSSPEPTPVEFKEELDDDSDEEDIPFTLLPIPSRCVTLSFTKPPHAADCICSDTVERETDSCLSRYGLRKRNASPVQRENQTIPPFLPAKKKPSPFDALLREKKAAEKKGIGSDAIRRADATAKTIDLFNASMSDEESDDEGLQVTDAVNLALQSEDLFQTKPRARRTNSEEECRDTGKEIVGILQRDVAIKEEDIELQRPRGICLWREDPHSMEVDAVRLQGYRLPGKSNLANTINSFIEQADEGCVDILLRADFSTAVEPESFDPVQPFENIIGSCMYLVKTISDVAKHDGHLGADSNILSAQKWTPPSTSRVGIVATEDREEALFCLTTMIGLLANHGKLIDHETPNFVIALLLIGLDITTAPDNQQDVIRLLDLICNKAGAERSKEIEICSRILEFIFTLEASVQCSAVLLLAQGSNVTRRVANYVAYCIIVDQPVVNPSTYSDKPPIENLRKQFQKSLDYPSKFVISKETDYVNLGFYVTILGVAISDIRGYVNEERHEHKKRQTGKDHLVVKPLQGLKALRDDMEALHSKISDARATHLERSRTKGCIKALSMNIHYQRDIWIKNDSENKTKTLAQYFRKK